MKGKRCFQTILALAIILTFFVGTWVYGYEKRDGKTWTFSLVKNAKFHNGDPVTAQAVKWSFERTLTLKKGPAWMLMDFLDKDGIRVIDDYNVEFTLKH